MFTDCPSCSRQFRISAGQLKAAHGQVKCGYCGTQFNALERLHDEPLPAQRSADLSIATPSVADKDEPEPEFDIPEAHPGTDAAVAPGGEQQWEPQSPAADAPQPTHRNEPGHHEKTTDFQRLESADAILTADPAALAEMLLNEPEYKTDKRGRWWWAAGAVLVLMAGMAQFFWFQRDEVLSRYPVLMPWMEKLCVRFDCNVIRFRDPSAIKLINRDVREHPRYEHALLVNATMSNQSRKRQPYPDIQLSLYDTEGSLIAHRTFTPDDYLDESIDVVQGMAPNVPVHFVLEVTGPTEGAVSFEFKFL